MHRIKEAIVVEGKYDKNALSQLVDAPIFVTNGFGIFKDKLQMDLLRRVAQQRGLVVFTDADGAGFVIRNHIKSAISAQYLKHAYTPDVFGKERRKTTAGKEGKLGVEGMRPEIILDALRASGATFLDEEEHPVGTLTKQDMVELGLSGGSQSAQRRIALQRHLNFPEHMSSNALLESLNLLYSKDEVYSLINDMIEI